MAGTASKPDALQGFHADDILYIIDEASGVDDKVFEPVLGALSTPGAAAHNAEADTVVRLFL